MKQIFKNSGRWTLALAALFVGMACSDQVDDTASLPDEQPIEELKAVIVNSPEGALQGELLVKFRPEVDQLLDKALTRATTDGSSNPFGVMTRSGISDMDRVLDLIKSYRIERVFPINRQESQTRLSGLHLWYIVHFDEQTDVREAAQELAQVGKLAKVQYSHELKRRDDQRPALSAPATNSSASQATALATRVAGAAYADSWAPFNDPELYRQWHYINTGDQTLVPFSKAGADVNCAEAWKRCQGDASIIVAVMDEGVMWAHPDLQDNMWVNEDEIYKSDQDNDGNGYCGDVYGFNFAEQTPGIAWSGDGDTGHGTHVAGTIAAVNNNGLGVCGIAGGSGQGDGVKIMSIQIFSGIFAANIYTEARGIKYAADNGAVILQCSWGYNSSLADAATSMRGYATDEQWLADCPVEYEALEYFVHNAGSPNGPIDGGLVIFAAGNEYAPAAGYPGAYGDFVSVAAMDASFMPASYTNYDRGVDITAPGGDSDYHRTSQGSVYSTMPPALSGGTGYGYMDGTSMACPHVSGVAALGLSYAAKLHKHFTAQQFKELLLQSVRPLELTENKLYYKYYSVADESTPVLMELGRYYNGRMGSGLVDADRLLTLVEGNGVQLALPNVYLSVGSANSQTLQLAYFFEKGEKQTFTVDVADTSVATAKVEGNRLNITGVAVGSTTFTVTASSGEKQQAVITVRRNANDNGWL